MIENSPAFERWDAGQRAPSPEGKADIHRVSRPFGTDPHCHADPAFKRWAILGCPSGTSTGPVPTACAYRSSPDVIGHSCPPGDPRRRCGQECPRSSRYTPGFTLVELMVVIVLIGIMTAMIIPEMKGTFEDALLRSTSRELVSVFGVAGSHAVSANKVLQVRLDGKKGHYAIEERVHEGGRESHFAPSRDLPGGEGELDTRISIEIHRPGEDATEKPGEGGLQAPEIEPRAQGPDDGITFYPDGTADAREVVLRDPDGFRLALRINPVTARVHIVELARE